ncbi:MAG: Jag N-terminal domain-containing protein, partial [Endomicrobium sp.]|nr:Jag N-terminal domain-containing protein [Endomicrobium sp.]
MLKVEFRGKSVDDALNKGLLYLNCNKEDVEIKIVSKGSSKFFGLMGTNKPAIILISVKNSNKTPFNTNHKKTCEKAEFILSQILCKMGIQLNKIESSFRTANITINITAIENSFVIGKNGQTLDALEYITQIIVNKEFDTKYKVNLDCKNYREKQKEKLKIITNKAIEYVRQTGKIYYFDRMSAKERKI